MDILQPCITFNSLNTYDWFRKRVYRLENHDTTNKLEAMKKAMEWPNGPSEEKIPIGIFYEEKKSLDVVSSEVKVDFESLMKEFV